MTSHCDSFCVSLINEVKHLFLLIFLLATCISLSRSFVCHFLIDF